MARDLLRLRRFLHHSTAFREICLFNRSAHSAGPCWMMDYCLAWWLHWSQVCLFWTFRFVLDDSFSFIVWSFLLLARWWICCLKGSKMAPQRIQNEAWRDPKWPWRDQNRPKYSQEGPKRDQEGPKMCPERAQETPLTAQGPPNAPPRRPNGSPEAPKMVKNGCQNRYKIDAQIRLRFLQFFQWILGEKIGDFWCYFFFRIFVCSASRNEKDTVVKLIEIP